ncbi:translocation protein SEC62 isoform X1 [Danaus plexippus]|uniref:translocation protein SEC62 isoform X1 n=1 Tax=Danaus plexippus TaxID=13037 RepID=UPI002AB2EB97|nr:translocation protein SEC62 isoform X1 [Danaus plexippus]
MADKRKTKKRKEEFGEPSESEKPTSEEYAVAKWLKANVPTKKTKFLNHHVEYFTGTRAVDALLTSKWATGKNPIFTTRHDITDFLHLMLLHKLFHRAKKVPVTEQELKGKSRKKDVEKTSKSGDEQDEKNQSACEGKETKDKDGKDKDKEKKKRKIRLEMHMEQVFLDTNDAYVWLYDPMPWYYWLCGALLLVGTVGVCMFPLWPATVRKGVYYLSIAAAGFLVLIIALAVLRVVVFCTVWVATLARHHLWLLPNLTEDVGFFASFWPLYKYEYRGPGSESDKSSKSKKKRKKEKHSDDEEEKTALMKESEAKEVKEKKVVSETADTTDNKYGVNEKEEPPQPETSEQTDKLSESESENSQRSSTDRDFEMIDTADVDEHAHTH